MDDFLDEVDDEEAAADENLGGWNGFAHAPGVSDAFANLLEITAAVYVRVIQQRKFNSRRCTFNIGNVYGGMP